jgi:ABC-type long-subunit fatty acid transport system fused permease/ATPase subunit
MFLSFAEFFSIRNDGGADLSVVLWYWRLGGLHLFLFFPLYLAVPFQSCALFAMGRWVHLWSYWTVIKLHNCLLMGFVNVTLESPVCANVSRYYHLVGLCDKCCHGLKQFSVKQLFPVFVKCVFDRKQNVLKNSSVPFWLSSSYRMRRLIKASGGKWGKKRYFERICPRQVYNCKGHSSFFFVGGGGI